MIIIIVHNLDYNIPTYNLDHNNLAVIQIGKRYT